MDEASPVIEFDDLARADLGGEPIERMTIVGDQNERRRHRDQPRLEPLDRLEVEVVRRLVEHDHVVPVLCGSGAAAVVGKHLGERNAFRLATGEFVGAAVEQRLNPERGRDRCNLPALAEVLRHRSGRQHRVLLEHRDPRTSTETDGSTVGLQRAGQDPQQRRLPRSVDPDHGHAIAARDRDGEIVEQHFVGLFEPDSRHVDADHSATLRRG